MSEPDRGAYTPQTDAPLAFDARYSRGGGDRPIPMTLIVSGVVLVTLVAALAFFYRGGVRGSGQAPQVVGTSVVDAKAPPSAQAASSDPAAGLQVYKAEAVPAHEGGAGSSAVLAPSAETPAPRPVAATPVDEAKLRPAQASVAAQTVAPPPAPAVVRAAVPAAPAKSVKIAALASGDTTLPKPAKAAKTAVAAKAAATPAPKADTAEIAAGTPVAQIGAFSSSALAEKGWGDVATLMPGQMAGKTRKVEMAVVNGKTFYRGFVGGFASKAAADSFCASLTAAGKGCIVK